MTPASSLPSPPATPVAPPPTTTTTNTKKKIVYLIRHAEATHNIEEKLAIQRAKSNGMVDKDQLEQARRAVLNAEELRDAPLSALGRHETQVAGQQLSALHHRHPNACPAPDVVLVSPLRRALGTATELFAHMTPRPKLVALELLREKRTGFCADERLTVPELQREFPHVDFSDLLRHDKLVVEPGEDNAKVRQRCADFLNSHHLTSTSTSSDQHSTIAICTHKGWLREMRHTFQRWLHSGRLSHVDFDLEHWQDTLYQNAEIRVNEFGFDGTTGQLTSIVSKSVDNAMKVGSTTTPSSSPPAVVSPLPVPPSWKHLPSSVHHQHHPHAMIPLHHHLLHHYHHHLPDASRGVM